MLPSRGFTFQEWFGLLLGAKPAEALQRTLLPVSTLSEHLPTTYIHTHTRTNIHIIYIYLHILTHIYICTSVPVYI